MNWINVNDSIPEPYTIVWIYWRNNEVLLGCRVNNEGDPTQNWYSFDDEKCKWANFWLPIESGNLDKPNKPENTITLSLS